tara:strand:+ start:478 stop:687 length:210 start_codon:yes stop_codon:yes gene_type:complete
MNQIGFYKNLPMHRKVRYLIDDPVIADVMIDHWAGENHEFDLPRANHFAQDVESCGLTLEQFLNNQWSK